MTDVTDWIEAGGAIAGMALGIGGMWFGYRGHHLAKDANVSAAAAAQAASDAVARADEANRIAEESNGLARDANTVSERALAVASDDIDYGWTLEVDESGAALIRNGSAHEAREVMVVIETNGESHESRRFDHAAAFEQLTLEVVGALEQHLEEVRRHPAFSGTFTGLVTMMPSDGKTITTVFRAHITWSTPAEVRRTTIVEEQVSHRMEVGGHLARVRGRD